MEDYKEDIVATRKGCLGGSDSKLLAQVATLGSVPRSAYKRLAICKGLIEPENITTKVMEYGNFIEQSIFEHLHAQDERYQSNPCLVSDVYSTKEVKIIDHVDFLLQDDEKKVLYLYECKASKFTTEQVRDTYKTQLYHHYLLGKEFAKKLGNYKTKVVLVHYDTSDVDMDNEWVFEPEKITIRPIKFGAQVFDMCSAVAIVSNFLANFTEYYDGDEIDANLLPEKVKKEFDVVSNILTEIKEREKIVDEFKKRLYTFMVDKNIKSLKNEIFAITRVDPTETKSFDSKRYVDDLKKEHPRKAKKVLAQYTKTTKRNGYVTIKTKNNND